MVAILSAADALESRGAPLRLSLPRVTLRPRNSTPR